ncbi:hypothetical protein D6D29_03466 [Aureobasidium pullulans]|uniref:Apple domain-containing protein n=1 Tax=Aureobasidium pullulans TaxID=5580 RepID=A0A4S8X6K7_AURPU|nr:hypothetical protein D6D29_03466 [Aureobasidium pullulans]THW33651.1 hypothetical protein D6D22_09011 [Aureobasidium pullulans]
MFLLKKSILLSFLLPLVSAGPSGFGHAFSSGPTADGNWIRTANSTLVVPSPPLPQKGLLSLWVGMGTSNGDLIQALVESYNDAIDAGCGVLDGDWCAWTSALVSTGQQGGKEVLANVGDEVKMSYMYNDATGNYDQYVLINGIVVSTFSTSSGKALGWGTAEECNQAAPAYPCGLTPAHSWINTILVLDQPQPDYSNTFGTFGASGTLTSSDGGKTWTADKLTIDAWNYTPTCPDDDGYKLTTLDNSVFNTTCNSDFVGGELKNSTMGSIQDCVTACDETENCFFAVWDGKNCGLKSSVAEKVVREGMIAGSLVSKGC